MAPYFEIVRSAVSELIENVVSEEAGERFSFGVIGYRDDPEGRPGTDYRTKVYAQLDFDGGSDAALTALKNMQAMSLGTSTWGFNEDAIAGVSLALRETVWEREGTFDFAGRIVILITDAGPKSPDDEHAESDLDAHGVRKLAAEARAALVTVHLRTPLGIDNHDHAEDQYATMSYFLDSPESLYFGVEDDSNDGIRTGLRRVMERLAESVVGEELINGDEGGVESFDAEADLEEVGLAMRLAYLGRAEGERVPNIIRGWTTDLSFERPGEDAVEPRILVTRSQLSTMTEVMRKILATSTRSDRGDSQTGFFDELREIVVGMSSDPERVVNGDFETVGGAISEFLERLPYAGQSPIMGLTETRWLASSSTRLEMRQNLASMIELYELYYKNDSLWTDLYPGENGNDGEKVFAMPFDSLP